MCSSAKADGHYVLSLDRAGLDPFRHLLDLLPHAQQVSAPEFGDVFFRVAAAHELERDIERFSRTVPALNAAAAVEVGRNADVIDTSQLHSVGAVMDEILQGGARRGRVFCVDVRHSTLILDAALG